MPAALLTLLTPYEVDHEMVLLPWLMRRGWTLYGDLVDQHPPLLPALVMLAGGGDAGLPLHLLIAGLQVVTLISAFLLASRLAGPEQAGSASHSGPEGSKWGSGSAGLWALLFVETWGVGLDGTRLWYDGALAPIYLWALLLLLKPTLRQGGAASTRLWATRLWTRLWTLYGLAFSVGLLLGIGAAIKQHALVAMPFVGVALWLRSETGRWKTLLAFAVGVTLVPLVCGLVLLAQGVFADAWYWVVVYNLTGAYVSAAAISPPPDVWPVLAAFSLPFVGLALLWRGFARRWPGFAIVFSGMTLAAILPMFPRWGAFHLQAAVPLMSVAGGVAIVTAWRMLRLRRGVFSFARLPALALILTGVSAMVGVAQWVGVLRFEALVGPPAAPYESAIAPLRAWVNSHAPGAPIFIYGLDPLLYRALEHEPPRPWSPQLPWMMKAYWSTAYQSTAGDNEARFWAGVERTRPAVALVSASGWAASPNPGLESGEARLRRDYHEVARFTVAIYPVSGPVEVVGLLRDDGNGR